MNVQLLSFPNSWFSNQQRKVLPVSDVGAQERLNEARELVSVPTSDPAGCCCPNNLWLYNVAGNIREILGELNRK